MQPIETGVYFKSFCQQNFRKEPEGGNFSQELQTVRAIEDIADAANKKTKGNVHSDTISVYNAKCSYRKKML